MNPHLQKSRPSWNSYFTEITQLVSTRSTCLRRQVGAIIVHDKRILATGYNGAPRDLPHCLEIGCLRDTLKIPSGTRHELCRGIHAEQNAIIQAATSGVNIEGAVLYCTHFPCSLCIKMIINASLKTIFYIDGYPDELAQTLAKEGTLQIIQLKPSSKKDHP